MRKIKRFLTMLFVLFLTLSLFPGTVQATEMMQFKDVKTSDWYYESVEYVFENGLMTGMQSDVFGPTIDMSRAMVVTVLWRMDGEPKTDYKAIFQDIPSGEWYAEPVLWANENGIVTGYENGMFGPSDNITREQMATMLYRYAKYRGLNTSVEGDLSGFEDVSKVSDFATASMKWAVGAELIKGLDSDTLGPAGYASRAQVATLLMRFCTSELLQNEEVIETSTNYAVCDLNLEEGRINVVVSTKDACDLLVEIVNEDGIQHYYQEKTALEANMQIGDVEVTIPASVSLPEHFVIRAKLLDAEGNLLCNPFICRRYTESYEKFLAKKESDYPENKLIDLVDENDGNFIVVHDDVILLEQPEGTNEVVSSADGVHIFESPDSVLIGLSIGDKICFCDKDGQYAAVKIKEIVVQSNGSVAVYEAADTYLADFYETIKIDTALVGIAEDSVARIAAYSEDNIKQREYLADIEMGPAISNTINTDFGSFEHKTTIGGKLELNYDFVLFGDDYLEFVMTVGIKSELGFVIGANKIVSDEIEIVSVPLVGLKDIAEIPAELSLSYDIDCKAGASTKISMEAAAGCVYNSYDGSQTVEYKKVTQGETEIKGEIDASMGPKFSVNAELLDEKVKASLGAEGGIGLKGKAVAFTAPLPGTDSYHACDLCVDGTIQGYFEVEMAADYDINEKLKGSIIDFDLLRVEWHLGRFYCSLINEEESVHKGDVVFDFGTCPNSKYRTIFHTYKNKEELTGYTTYFYPGKYSANAVIDRRTDVKEFTVSDKPINVNLLVRDYYLRGTVTDSDTNKPISGATITVQSGGTTVTSTTTNSNGQYEVLLINDGNYEVTFSKSGYRDATASALFTENEIYTLNMSLKPEMYKVKITVTYWNQPVSGATVQGSGLPTGLVTGSDGTVTVELPAGNYTLTARGNGYYGNASISVNKNKSVTIDMYLLDHL